MARKYVHPDDIWDAIVDVEVVGAGVGLEQFVMSSDKDFGNVLRNFIYDMCVAIACTVNAAHPECEGIFIKAERHDNA